MGDSNKLHSSSAMSDKKSDNEKYLLRQPFTRYRICKHSSTIPMNHHSDEPPFRWTTIPMNHHSDEPPFRWITIPMNHHSYESPFLWITIAPFELDITITVKRNHLVFRRMFIITTKSKSRLFFAVHGLETTAQFKPVFPWFKASCLIQPVRHRILVNNHSKIKWSSNFREIRPWVK